MALLIKPLKPVTHYTANLIQKYKNLLLGVLVIVIGASFGFTANFSEDAAWILVSVVCVVIVLLITIQEPLHGLLLLLGLFSFIEYWIEIPLGEGLPDLSFSRFMIGFLAIFMLAQGAIGKFRFAKITLVEIAIIGTIIGISSSVSMAENPIRLIQQLFSRFFASMVLYYYTRNLILTRSDLYKFFWVIVLLGFAGAIYAVYEISTGHILFYSGGEEDITALRTVYTGNLTLLQGLFGTSPTFGRIFAMIIPITFYMFFETKPTSQKIFLVIIVTVQFVGLFLSYNRTSWYAAMIGLTILQFFYTQFRPVYLAIVLLALITLLATWDQVSQTDVVENRVNKKTEDFNGRSEIWATAQRMWEKKPIRGWGDGAFRKESGTFRADGRYINFTSTQSEFWDVLVHFGLIGFVPYVAFLLLPLISSIILFFWARGPDWQGFIKSETIAIYWTVFIVFVLGGYTVQVTVPIARIIPFTIFGAIVGSHAHLLKGSKSNFERTTLH